MFAQHDNMTLSIEELKTIVKNLRKDGLNSQPVSYTHLTLPTT